MKDKEEGEETNKLFKMLLINKTMAKNPIGNNKSYKINANKL